MSNVLRRSVNKSNDKPKERVGCIGTLDSTRLREYTLRTNATQLIPVGFDPTTYRLSDDYATDCATGSLLL
jgi:hypothetical protein